MLKGEAKISEREQAKLRWRCRRGMLELDLLLEPFCAKGLSTLTVSEGAVLAKLLQLPDPDLLACLMSDATPVERQLHAMVARIQSDLKF